LAQPEIGHISFKISAGIYAEMKEPTYREVDSIKTEHLYRYTLCLKKRANYETV